MRFLIDADLPRSAAEIIRRYGHKAVDVRDIGLRDATDAAIAHHAQVEQLCLVTGDTDFSNIINYPPEQYAGLIVLSLPRTATAAYINQLLGSFMQQSEIIAKMPGKPAIVEPGRVRLRGKA